MYWNNNEENSPRQSEAPPSGDSKLAWLDLFKRDFSFWYLALCRSWLLLLLAAIGGAVFLFLLRTVATENLYSSRAALVRQESVEGRGSNMMPGFVPPKTNVIFNFMVSRNCLEDTIKLLKLDWTNEQLFRALSFKTASRNSNYLFLTATTNDPELAAEIANTHVETFLAHYKKLSQEYLKEPYETVERNQRTLSAEMDELQLQLKKFTEEHKITILERDREILLQRLVLEEDRYFKSTSDLDLARTRVTELKARLAAIPQTAVIYSERNTLREQNLTQLKMELVSLRQQYTEENPIIHKQLARVEEAEKSLKEEGSEGESKVVTGINPEYSSLRTEIIKTEADLQALEVQSRKCGENLEAMKARRDLLNRIAPEYSSLMDQINLKRNMMRELETRAKQLEMFKTSEYSDISLHERAIPNYTPQPRNRALFAVAGFFLGGFLAMAFVLVREATNLSVRSRTDLEEALHLDALGIIPRKTPQSDAVYYSALQSIVVKCEEKLAGSPGTQKLVVAPCGNEPNFEVNISEMLSMIDLKDIKYLWIKPAPDGPIDSRVLINDYLYGISPELPKPTGMSELFFKLDEMALIAPLSAERLQELHTKSDYQLIIWELFAYEKHPQLYSDICQYGNMTIIPLHFATSSKLAVSRIIASLRRRGVQNICGVLYDVANHFYKEVHL